MSSAFDNHDDPHTSTPSFASMVFDLDPDEHSKPSNTTITTSQRSMHHSPPNSTSYDLYPAVMVKSEPDLTIPLGWDGLSTSPSQASNLSHDSPASKYVHPPTPAFDASDYHLAPPYASPSVEWSDLNQNQYVDGLFASSNTNPGAGGMIPWAQWTEFDYEQGLDMDMPQTPIDPLPSADSRFDVYTHTNGSDVGFFERSPRVSPQTCPSNLDLLPHFTSMQLESPPQTHRTPPTATYTTARGDDSDHHQHSTTAPFYDGMVHPIPSGVSAPMPVARPMPVISAPRNPIMDMHSEYHLHRYHHLQQDRNLNLIPTLSSSLPASLAVSSPPLLSSSIPASGEEGLLSPSPSLDSPPGEETRVRSRAKSDASAPPTALPSPAKQHSPRHGLRRRRAEEVVSPTMNGVDASPLKPPKQSLSTWQIFFTDWIARQDANGGRKLNVAQAAKEAGKEYKLLTRREKEPYERRAAEARAGRQAALSSWHSTLTPSLIALENRYRTAQRKLGLSRKSNLKDPNAPKKPLSAYFMFLRAVREDDTWAERVFEGEKETTRQSVMAAAKWRQMSDDEKRPFLARAEQEKLEYEAARKEYEDSFAASGASRDSSSSPTGGGSGHHHRVRSNSTGSTAMAFRLDDIAPPLASSAPTSAMGYFSANSSGAIPIHIPKRSRAESSPSPTSPYSGYL